MSSAVMRIQVATLTDVSDGQARIDGVPDQLVTLRSVGSGSSHLFRFWDVTNPSLGSATAPVVPTITPIGDGRTFTFTPPGGASGYGQSFGIELIVDQGLDTEVRSRHIYAIPTQNTGIVLPVFAEGADPQASLQNHGATQVANCADNAGGNWRGYHPRLIEWIALQDKSVGQIYVSPSPTSAPPAVDATIPVHVATVYLQAGTLFSLAADIGDLVSVSRVTTLALKLQASPFTQLTSLARTGLKLWTSSDVDVAIPADAAYELYIHSDDASGVWACKGIRLLVR